MTTLANWKYTAAEKRAIVAAFDEIAYMLDAWNHSAPHRFREALKIERRERSCITTAKALLVNGFAEGMKSDPPASTLAGYSEGIAVAVMIGADYGRRRRGGVVGLYDPTPVDRQRLPELLTAAKAAHDAHMKRGLSMAARGN